MRNLFIHALCFATFLPTLAAAQTIALPNPIQAPTLTALFTALLEIVMIVAMPIVAFFIIYAGFLYVTARGNVQTIEQAHRALLYAVIGGVLVLGGNVLIQIIDSTVSEFKSN